MKDKFYIGNRVTKEIHINTCKWVNLMNKKNQLKFSSINEAIKLGFNGCGHCLPKYNNVEYKSIKEGKDQKEVESSSRDPPATTEDGDPWDVIVVGGGPIGLSVAKLAKSSDLKVIVLEKESQCAPEKRAETIIRDPIVDAIWGNGFVDSLKIQETIWNKWYSPDSKKQTEMVMSETPNSFDWDQMIGNMVNILGNMGVNIYYNYKVTKPVIDDSLEPGIGPIVIGVETDTGEIINGKTVFDCSGCRSQLGSSFIDYDEMCYWMIKCRVSAGFHLDYPNFQSFFLPAGAIKKVVASPPAIAYIFPQPEDKAEIGCLIFHDYGLSGSRSATEPEVTKSYVEEMWKGIKSEVPVFLDSIKGATISIEHATEIPCRRLLEIPMKLPGLVFVGDSGGHVFPGRATGLICGMKVAKWWIKSITEMKEFGLNWSTKDMRSCNYRFKTSEIYLELEKDHSDTKDSKNKLWNFFKTPFWINSWWWAITDSSRNTKQSSAYNMQDSNFNYASPKRKAAIINAIAHGVFVNNDKQKRIMELLELAHGSANWNTCKNELDVERLYDKIQGIKRRKRLRELVPYYVTCPRCDGSGKIRNPETCPKCKGEKVVKKTYYYWTGEWGYWSNGVWHKSTKKLVKGTKWVDCPRCRGDGMIKDCFDEKECPRCNGKGEIQK